jgi:hypothetical protein
MADRVECHSGYAYAQRPTALWWEGARLEVEAVQAEWRTPEGKVFRVCVAGGRVFEVLYNEPDDQWTIQLLGLISDAEQPAQRR